MISEIENRDYGNKRGESGGVKHSSAPHSEEIGLPTPRRCFPWAAFF
jgi:hypothetical protein